VARGEWAGTQGEYERAVRVLQEIVAADEAVMSN
jgi:hypothetical protein